MKKAYIKSTGRLFLKHLVRLLSIAAVFIVTVSLISGLGDVDGDIKDSITASYRLDHVHDFTLRGADLVAIPKIKEIIDNDKDTYDISSDELFRTFDYPDNTINNDLYSKRIEIRNFTNTNIDKLELIGEGSRFPSAANEVVVERGTKDIAEHNIGDTLDIHINISGLISINLHPTIVGIVKNPTMVTLTKEPSDYFNNEDGKYKYLNDVFYFNETVLDDQPLLNFIPASLNLTIKNRALFASFSEDYRQAINVIKGKLQTIHVEGAEMPSILTLYENYSLYSLNSYAEKVGALALIFIIFFILIAVLVIYSTISRLIDEDRKAVAVLKTLGYSNFAIAIRYVIYAFVAGVVGIAISVAPAHLVSRIILNAFNIQYAMKPIELPIVGNYFFLLANIILLISLILTLIKSIKTANHSPVELLTPKTPKAGKKVLLEKIKFIWDKLSFKYKSTFRNVFLFKSRLLMTVLSIMSATVMVFASFALLDNTLVMHGFESVRIISLILLGFSAALCALVIYNITNINISERTREVATLMVLGYRNPEVTGYIYREIYILTAIGSILGLPAGVGFIQFVFTYVGVFELSSVNWWTYIISPIITFLFAVMATHLLHHKIVHTDMNESLKVLE